MNQVMNGAEAFDGLAGAADLREGLLAETLRDLNAMVPLTSAWACLGALSMAYALSDVAPPRFMVVWLVIAIGAQIAKLLLYLSYRRAGVAPQSQSAWLTGTRVVVGAHGLAWAGLGMLMFQAEAEHRMFIALALALVGAARTVSLAADLAATVVGSGPIVLMLLAGLSARQDRTSLVAAAAVTLSVVFVAFAGGRLRRGRLQSLQLRAQLAEGEARLEDAGARCRELEADLKALAIERAAQAGETDARFHRIFRETPLPLGIAAVEDGRFIDVNDAALRLFGHTREDVIGRSPDGLWLWANPDERDQYRARLLRDGMVEWFEAELLRHDRPAVTAMFSSKFIELDGRPRIVHALVDVTDRTRADQALARTMGVLNAMLDTTTDGIVVVNAAGGVEAFNRTFAHMWRIPDPILAERSSDKLMEWVVPQLASPQAAIESVRAVHLAPDAESLDRVELRDGRVFERRSRPIAIDGKPFGRVWSFRDLPERPADASRHPNLAATPDAE